MNLSNKGNHGDPCGVLSLFGQIHALEGRALSLNVLLLGDWQSGRSSVGNALIGGEEFPTGSCAPCIPMTTECQLICRTFRHFFRRQGEESDLRLRVIDTPPLPHSLDLRDRVCELFPEGVHVLVLVVRVDWPYENVEMAACAQILFGPEWSGHALLVLTHADHLRKMGLNPARYLTQASDWLRSLVDMVGGRVLFLDNSSDWPVTRGKPLRDSLLSLSASNHHTALLVKTEGSSEFDAGGVTGNIRK
ncbi:GTPase IMAP family member GIMD1-like [Lampris incognitus]|uniref:GTPase IMAP family member GIMD1-like n=1 Tax=Lampris incognitus TaxID=2546036 RepID=UPI0024B4DD87|nr:GTPase IMAP family member GIMD1-like [Lampris incognitus]XP_056156702.1 GTPase IMAP family member GIMD1-like [Lampris incognitus]